MNSFEAAVDVKYIAIYKYLIHLAPPQAFALSSPAGAKVIKLVVIKAIYPTFSRSDLE